MNTPVKGQAEHIYADHQQRIYVQTDRMFAVLMVVQWMAGIVAALVVSPRTWIGQTSEIHLHVWAAVFLGGVISFFPIALAILRPGHIMTRYTIAVAQMLMSSLLIHLSGGRIETHFHVFGSLAFLSFYRDWRVLIPATVVVATDHLLRGIFYPQSVFGVLTTENWRWVEHAGWVIFEDVFLVISCLRGQKEMWQNASDTARLNTSEERYRVVTDSASDVIMTIDHEHTILFVNPAAEKIFGYTVDEMIGNKLFMLIPEQLLDAHAAGMERYNETNKRGIPWQGVELPALHKDGHEVPVEVTFGEIKSGGKRLFTAVIRDITERKRAREELQQNLSLLTSTFEATAEGFLVVDNGNKIVTYNQQFVDMAQIPDEIIRSMDNARVTVFVMDQLLNGDVIAERIKRLNLHPETQIYDVLEFKDGRIFESYSHPRSLDGKVVGRVVSFHDITERKRAEIESKVISEIIQGVTTTSNLEELLALVQRSIGRVIYAENFYVALYDKQTELLHVPFCMDKFDTCAPPQKLGRGLTAYAIRCGRPTLLNAEDVDRLVEQGEVESVGTSSAIWLGIPLRTPTEIIGVLVVQHYEDTSAYTERDIELLSSAAGQIALAIQRKRAEEDLRDSAANLAAAQRITHLGSWVVDLTGSEDIDKKEVRWSDETYRIFGFEPGHVEISSEIFYNSVHPDDRTRVAELLIEALEQRRTYNIEHRIILPDGSERTVHGQAELVFDDRTGKPVKLLGTLQDITERRRTDAALRDSEFKLRTLFASMNEGLIQVDNNEVMEFVNDRLCEMTGYERDELLGKTTLDIFFDDEGRMAVTKANKERQKGISGQYEARLRKKSGEMLWALVSGAPIIDDKGVATGTLGMFMDITTRKRAEEQLHQDAFHDGLTRLANRALYMDHLRMTIERCKSRHSNPYAVLFLDFDRFKVINDSLGHAEGDELLKQIARRLELSTRTGDLVARLGGDEFVILLSEMLDVNDAVQVAERIQDDLKKPFDLNGSEVFISASIGIALSTGGYKHAEEMLRDADIAMYRAKAKGKARYQVFNRAMREQATSRLQLETEMRASIERHEFEVHYQPIVNLETSEIIGFEALVRWRHPTRGMIPPDNFIPAAEENGLILPLGRWILGESCRQMREWQDAYAQASSLMVSVNLSCKQFLQSDLAEQVGLTLKATGLAPRCLKLEITESYLIENIDKAIKIMNRLRDIGVELSLDDFGTGYSSLSYLHRLPVSSLKIDRSFISRMTDSEENNEIVHTIVKLAQNLKMQVIAEGIETDEQLAQLNQLNCGFGQGYLFAKPMEAERAAEFINENLGNLSGLDERPVINLELNM